MALALEGTPVHNNFASGGNPVTTSAFTTGNPAEVFLAVTLNGSTISSITGGSLTWALRKRQGGTGSQYIELWAAQASGALSGVAFTINFAAATTFVTSDVFAFSGQDTSTIWDSNVSVPAGSGNGQGVPADPVAISTSNANDVIIAVFREASIASPTQGTGFTLISGANFQMCEYQIVSATQTSLSCAQGAGSATNSNACIADALMAAAAYDPSASRFPDDYGVTDAGMLMQFVELRGF